MKSAILILAASFGLSTAAEAQTAACSNQPIDVIKAKYQPQYDQLQKDGDDIKHDTSLSGKVGWKDQEFVFDTPTATMKTQKIVVGLPQVTMRDQDIIFDTPSVRMKMIQTGQYPEFHGFRIEFKPIYISVPEPFMQRQKIKMGIPEFRWDNTDIKFDLPEFTMQRQKIIIGLPQFTVTEIHINAEKVEKKSEALKDKAATLQQEQKLDLTSAVHETFACQRSALSGQSASAMAEFDSNLKKLSDTISDLSAKGVDVAHLPDGKGGTVDLTRSKQILSPSARPLWQASTKPAPSWTMPKSRLSESFKRPDVRDWLAASRHSPARRASSRSTVVNRK